MQPKPNSINQTPSGLSKKSGVRRKKNGVGKKEGPPGTIDVYIHQARDIHNICIYHKQDVYAKFCMTSDPETTVSTQIINGGGRNPIFNENLRLNVKTIDSSLKCEIWMSSKIRNYLEDQLLGFALVPLCDVVTGKGKLEQEFPLSSSDLSKSVAGFVQLTLTYTGSSHRVLEILTPRSSSAINLVWKDSEVPICVSNELDKMEFPDPVILNENEMMVSEYFAIPCDDLETTDTGEYLSSEDGSGQIGEGFSIDSVEVSSGATPPYRVSVFGPPSASVPTCSQVPSDTRGASRLLDQDSVSSLKEKIGNADSAVSVRKFEMNTEPKKEVVQQEIVDMYMKSMQQFTQSLAKMKLPLDIDNGSADSGETGSVEEAMKWKNNGQNVRVFYGSRAFF